MTQQPEFTPRRGDVSSHYEAPKVPSDRPQEPSPPVWRFTIVEALVVITAIMILWSLLFPAVRAVHS